MLATAVEDWCAVGSVVSLRSSIWLLHADQWEARHSHAKPCKAMHSLEDLSWLRKAARQTWMLQKISDEKARQAQWQQATRLLDFLRHRRA